MARKDTPWQADFNAPDKARIVRWMIDQNPKTEYLMRDLLHLEWWRGRSTDRMLFNTVDFQGNRVMLAANVGPKLLPVEVRKAFRVLGLTGADAYIQAHRDFIERHRPAGTEDRVFELLWLNLSHAGAGANLKKILTADKADAQRWRKALKKSGKAWPDVRLSTRAAAEIADSILGEILGKGHRRGGEPLRTRFKAYIKKHFTR
jgi:hypothetical protein